jgi:nuclear transport factor 2 (NTF2) superfamily protein
MLPDLSEATLRHALPRFEAMFAQGDVDAIVDLFADDAYVRYGRIPPFTGREQLREVLRQRFAQMRDYRLVKRLEFIAPPRYAASWTGTWIDTTSGHRVQSFGLELITVREGKISEWVASVSFWPADAT